MLLTVIIPAFNEEKTIEEAIRRVSSVSLPVEKEIIVVNDGSCDGTPEILKKIKNNFNFILLEHKENRGKGAAIRTAISFAKGDYILVQDADLELNPQDFSILLEPVLKENAEVVFGSRTLSKENASGRINLPFFLGGLFLTSLANLLYGINITDEAIGYKLIKSNLAKSLNLKCDRFDFCPEVTAKIAKKKVKIYEVPVSYVPRSVKEGKKVKWEDGLKATWVLFKYRFFD